MSALLLASEATQGVATSPLTAAVVIPFLGAVVVALVPSVRVELHRLVALLFATGTGAITLWLLADFDTQDPGFQFEVNRSWISDFGISWHLGIDGVSLFLVVLSGLLFPIAIVAVTPHHDQKPYYAWLLVLQGGCIGVFCALDLFVFFVMFEIVLVPMYFLIGGWGYADRVYAALKFFIFTMLGSALMLVGIVSLAFLHRDGVAEDNEPQAAAIEAEAFQLQQEAEATGAVDPETQAAIDADLAEADELRNPQLDFDLVEIAESQHLTDDSTSANPFDWSAVRWIFLAFAVAFAVKVPLFPLHTWLPDAHTQAPTAGSVILAGVMLKLGTYGLLRFGLYLFPEASVWFAPGLVALGVIGIIYGAVVATMQRDLKRLVAYSSVAHLGFIVLGTFALTTQGIQGGVMQMVNHGHVHRRAVPPRRHDLRAPPHPGDRRAEGPAEVGADPGRRLHRGHAQLHRPAGPERLLRRVPHPRGVVPDPPLVHGRGRGRRDPRRPVPAVGLPAGVPRRARRARTPRCRT